MSSRVGPDLPTEAQIAHLQRLYAAAGKRYVAPRTGKQARSRIRDLQATYGQVQPRSLPRPPHDDGRPLAPLLAKLSRAHYNDAPRHVITGLQNQIERILEASRPH